MNWLHIFADYLEGLFLFFTLDLFLNSFFKCKSKEKQLPIKFTFIILWLVLAFTPPIPYSFALMLLLDLLYAFFILIGSLRSKLLALVKYELYYYICSTVTAILHTMLTMDLYIFGSNEIYADYTNILGSFYLYVILSMYIIHKKLSMFSSGKIYKRYFLTITAISVMLLTASSMLLGSTLIKPEDLVPLIFTLLLVVTLLCISIYRKVITVLEESTRAKLEAEKNAMQLDYQEHIEENLKALSTLRHDFKNHLIIIQEYARCGNYEKLQHYVGAIQEELSPTALINTPSHLISSLLNAKNETCKRNGIKLNFEQCFTNVHADDFHMVTILSNLMDNAITAAAKCENGYINLSISEVNSYLEISCVNNHKEAIIEKNNVFQTTKTTQREIHGIGIISIQKAVEALRGKIKIDYTEDTFTVNILLPNY